MTVGYARLSATGHDPARQIHALRERGCERIFTDHFRGRKGSRPQLAAALDSLGTNGTLVVRRLDRLARSIRHLVAL